MTRSVLVWRAWVAVVVPLQIAGLPWNEHNKDKAKRLLQEAGYKKEPIRFYNAWLEK